MKGVFRMKMWALTDFENRLIALNPGNMDGCTDWVEITCNLSISTPITDDRGAALYKIVNGEAVLRTQEEREKGWTQDVDHQASDDERMIALEEQIEMLLSGVTDDE